MTREQLFSRRVWKFGYTGQSDDSHSGGMELVTKFHYVTQNGMQLKTYNYLFLKFSVSIYFFGLSLTHLTEIMECKIKHKRVVPIRCLESSDME